MSVHTRRAANISNSDSAHEPDSFPLGLKFSQLHLSDEADWTMVDGECETGQGRGKLTAYRAVN